MTMMKQQQRPHPPLIAQNTKTRAGTDALKSKPMPAPNIVTRLIIIPAVRWILSAAALSV